jgi:DNA processing protein
MEHREKVLGGDRLPRAFREVRRPCRAVYVRGVLPAEATPRVAIVGSRSPSTSGRRAAYEIAYTVARAEVVVVSGLARGIDAAAHQGALDAGGVTVAFLGSGLDVIYPRSSRLLAETIPVRGALISEYPSGTPPIAYQFVERQRLVAAYSQGVLVVEAGGKSGALITAGLALELGREVWAVPGDPGRLSTQGSNRLLRDGAGCILDGGDLLVALGLTTSRSESGRGTRTAPPAGLSSSEERVWRALGDVGTALPETLARRTALPVAQLFEALSLLELAGHVRREEDGYVLTRAPG